MSKTIVSQSELGRMLGRSRSHMSELVRGELRPALVSRGRVDASHAVVLEYAKRIGVILNGPARQSPAVGRIVIQDRSISAEQAARETESTVAQVLERCAAAVIPVGHVDATTFARLAGVKARDVVRDCEGPLRDAVTSSGRLDLLNRAALEYMAAHPFERGEDGDPIGVPTIDGAGFLVPACVGDNIDIDHPRARVFMARCGNLAAALNLEIA